jgi:hypothetical protein
MAFERRSVFRGRLVLSVRKVAKTILQPIKKTQNSVFFHDQTTVLDIHFMHFGLKAALLCGSSCLASLSFSLNPRPLTLDLPLAKGLLPNPLIL